MTIDVNARARVLGISTSYLPPPVGNAQVLPQRIAVFAQGCTASSYSTTKFTAQGSNDVALRMGYGSPAHLITQQLMPANGDGVGSIPVDVFPLVDAGGSAAAAGDITPSGTATASGTYNMRIAGIVGNAFTIPSGAIGVTATCALIGLSVSSVLWMPVTVGYIYGGVTASAITGTGNGTVTSLSVHSGSVPTPGAYTLVCNTVVTNGGVFTLTDPNGVVISSALTITPGVSGTCVASNAGGLDFTITDGSTDFGLNASFTITVPATKVTFTAKWKGASGNDIAIEVLGPVPSLGVAFAITQMASGAVDPTLTTPLVQVGNTWETMVINAFNSSNTTALNAFQTWGEGQWNGIVRRPAMVFCGGAYTTEANAAVATGARPGAGGIVSDRINVLINVPGSVNLPCVIAARAVVRIAVVANNNPPTSYATQMLDGIIPGSDATQWQYLTQDASVKAGCSTVDVTNGVAYLSDVVTMYVDPAENPPPYSYVVSIVRLQNIIYNVQLTFLSAEWAAAPLIPDNQATNNPKARHPSSAIAEMAAIEDNLGLAAIISDPSSSKKKITAHIDSTNPNRLDMQMPVSLSGNTNIMDVSIPFSFFFGVAAAA